jgi:5-methylcytosine-specific restriction endonuclease McrA
MFVSNELAISQFRAQVHGGSNERDNLVYACTACNRYKSDHWPDDAPEDFQLLNANL